MKLLWWWLCHFLCWYFFFKYTSFLEIRRWKHCVKKAYGLFWSIPTSPLSKRAKDLRIRFCLYLWILPTSSRYVYNDWKLYSGVGNSCLMKSFRKQNSRTSPAMFGSSSHAQKADNLFWLLLWHRLKYSACCCFSPLRWKLFYVVCCLAPVSYLVLTIKYIFVPCRLMQRSSLLSQYIWF